MFPESPKLRPLAPEHWPEELAEIRAGLVKPLNIHAVMAHHPDLLKAWMPLRDHVVGAGSLSPRARELIILRTAHHCRAEYEWQHHVVRGREAGLSGEEIERVKRGPGTAGWPPDEAALLAAADDCCRDFCIADRTRLDLDRWFSTRQQLDITVTVGVYMTLALIINTYEVPMETDL